MMRAYNQIVENGLAFHLEVSSRLGCCDGGMKVLEDGQVELFQDEMTVQSPFFF